MKSFITLACGLLVALSAHARPPQLGAIAPVIGGRDLFEQVHSSREWRGRRTLVVAMTDADAGGEMRKWFKAAQLDLPDDIRLASIVSIKLPFFATEGMARDRARSEVPREYWKDTWLDRDGSMARGLGLPVDATPYVFALDDEGRVIASVHAPVSDPVAVQLIWSALGAG